MEQEINQSAVLPNKGLTSAQVAQRLEAGLDNAPVEAPTKTIPQIIAGNIFTYFNLVFAALAVVVILVGAWRELLFLPVVVINSLIGIVQEVRAKKTLDKMTLLSAPRFMVVRDGRDRTVNTADLVKDDLVKFGPGQQIPADAKIIEGEVLVNESLITGEADEILKTPGMGLLSGSYIVSGGCKARLEKVGAASFVSKLTLEAKSTRKVVRSEMMRSLSRLVLVIGILIIPVGIGLFFHQWMGLGEELQQSVVTTVAALVGMVPEGLYLLTSVALAVSVIQLSKRKTLVHELGCIETLARVNVLCVDKTGTITEPEMLIEELIPLTDKWDAESILADHCLNLGGENDTMKALTKKYGNKAARTAVATLPFNSKNKFSAALYDNGECYMLGAPEFILGEAMPQTEPYVQRGLRVLLIARAESLDNLDSVEPVALVTLSNKIRKNAEKTFKYFAEQGVEIKVISGDNPQTVSFIAGRAGITNAEKWVDATTLSDENISGAAMEYTVFGRVTPEQKRKLVLALKSNGKTVAMTGDGVNDILALKAADCSVAMASGSEVAAQASHLVLLDSDFGAMPGIVAEGRKVINNIQRSASLFLVKNIFSFLFAILSIVAGFAYPVSPAQLSLVSMLTIGVPSFILALEPNEGIVKGHFLRGVFFRALPGSLTDVFISLGVVLFALEFVEIQQASTVNAILLAIVGFMVMYRVCKPFTTLRIVLCIFVGVALLVSAIFLGPLFALEELSRADVMVLVVFALLTYPMIAFISRIMDKCLKIYEKGKLTIYFKKTNREAQNERVRSAR